ncbi:alpha/beta fold hydrolase [Methylobacterium pseudosasicola]|uniref:Pimeloyl-ACP methyl ester carboxylesterase n=1 Tax=Methylobacterium pseudosasicola TaxID=582667 RepID=A0A1I4PS54_9HYPH|nr:alpha/beta fold hydrolase [Methylobacterium pseudosasicola]SFM30587.1 Pimeloyl-ACP methyl ester carboxylesterase [Methylobacterium pseudosasicola]
MTPLVLLPGLLNDGDLWRDQVAALSDVAACQIADITQGETLADLADAILESAPSRFALAGFSLGGYVAQEVLRQAPERITRLALLDTSIRPDDPARASARRALDKAARAPGRFHGFGDKLLATYLDPSHLDDAAIVSRIRGMTERLGPEVFVRQNNVERRDGREVLRRLSCPLLIVCGENDFLTPPEIHREMADLVPGARLVIIPRCGHMTPIEDPHAVSMALRRWLLDETSHSILPQG